MVPQVSKNLQLRHQSLLLRGVSISCNHTVIIIYIYIIMFFIIVGYLFIGRLLHLQLATQFATLCEISMIPYAQLNAALYLIDH